MAVPKATVDENDASTLTENDVGASGEIGRMEAVTVAETIEQPADQKFRSGIFPAHGGHRRASLLRRQTIHGKDGPGVSGLCMAMFFVVMDIAEGDEIVRGVLAFIFVMAYMVQLKHFSRVVRRQHRTVPTTADAFEAVPL